MTGNDVTKMFIKLPLTIWGQIVFEAHASDDVRLKALIDQAIMEAENVEPTMRTTS